MKSPHTCTQSAVGFFGRWLLFFFTKTSKNKLTGKKKKNLLIVFDVKFYSINTDSRSTCCATFMGCPVTLHNYSARANPYSLNMKGCIWFIDFFYDESIDLMMSFASGKWGMMMNVKSFYQNPKRFVVGWHIINIFLLLCRKEKMFVLSLLVFYVPLYYMCEL